MAYIMDTFDQIAIEPYSVPIHTEALRNPYTYHNSRGGLGSYFTFNGPFEFEKNIQINTKSNPTYQEVFDTISKNPHTYLNFKIVSENKVGYGNGATKQIYQYVMDDLVKKCFFVYKSFFMDINDSDFWNYEDNIELFVSFFGMYIHSGCELSYHLNPILLLKISGCDKTMNKEECMHFFKYYNYDVYSELNKNPEIVSATGYDSIEEYILTDYFFDGKENWKFNMYDKIALEFNRQFGGIIKHNVIELDSLFSGYYELKVDDIIEIIQIDMYHDMWENFIRSLTITQIKKMLLLFGNTLSLDTNFHISVFEYMDTDISISTCTKYIKLNKKLFENELMLSGLKLYFDEVDQTIVDHYDIRYSSDVIDMASISDTDLRERREISDILFRGGIPEINDNINSNRTPISIPLNSFDQSTQQLLQFLRTIDRQIAEGILSRNRHNIHMISSSNWNNSGVSQSVGRVIRVMSHATDIATNENTISDTIGLLDYDDTQTIVNNKLCETTNKIKESLYKHNKRIQNNTNKDNFSYKNNLKRPIKKEKSYYKRVYGRK